MTDTAKGSVFYSDEISLYYVLQSLFKHKKVFWSVFFLLFVVSSVGVLFHPQNYRVTQVIEIGRFPDSSNNSINVNRAKFIIEKSIIPKAKIDYCSSREDKKLGSCSSSTISIKSDTNVLFLSADVPLTDVESCNFIFERVKDFLMSDAKKISNRLNEIHLLKKSLEKEFADFPKKPVASGIDGKFSGWAISNLAHEIDMIQAKANHAIFPNVLTGVLVSEKPVGLSKLLLFVLSFFMSFFVAFFTVFIVEAVSGCNKYKNKSIQ